MAFCTAGGNVFVPLCSIPVQVMRDGYGGPNASVYVPFVGRWYADGREYVYPGSEVAQTRARTMNGRNIPGVGGNKGFSCS